MAMAQEAAPPPSPSADYVAAKVITQPTNADFIRNLSPTARSQDLDGVVKLTCTIELDGSVDRCTPVSETPPGLGLSETVIQTLSMLKYEPARRGGQAITTRLNVSIPVRYRIPVAPQFVMAPMVKWPPNELWQLYYPKTAKAQHKAGTVEVTCDVTEAGITHNCKVSQEDPPGMGFGEAGLKVAAMTNVQYHDNKGRPVARDNVRMPMRFTPSGPPPPMVIARPQLPVRESNPMLAGVSAAVAAVQINALWPAAAARSDIGGRVRVRCRMGARGSVDRCEAEAADPDGYGFRKAAVTAAQVLQLPASAPLPPGAEVVFPVRFGTPKLDNRIDNNISYKLPGQGVSVTMPLTPTAPSQPAPRLIDAESPQDLYQPGQRVPPELIALPSPARMSRYFPEDESAISGRVTVNCVVQADNVHIDGCSVVEAPSGSRFGQAAINLATEFTVTKTGLSYRPINLTFLFNGNRSPDQRVVVEAINFAYSVAEPARPSPKARPKRPKPTTRTPALLWLPISFALATLLGALLSWLLPSGGPRRKGLNPALNY